MTTKNPTPPEPEDVIREHVDDLTQRYLDNKNDRSDAAQVQAAKLAGQLRRLTHDQRHPGEELVELDVPFAVAGETFKINEVEYYGRVTVPACTAQTLLHMIDNNRRVDQDRMRERGRTMNLGDLNARARMIGRDD